MSSTGSCSCSGIRFCAACKDTPRVKSIFAGDTPLQGSGDVIKKQQHEERTSSCSFALIGKAKQAMCIECEGIFLTAERLESCQSHVGLQVSPLSLSSVKVVRNFVSEDEEECLLRFLENPEPFPHWKQSQSGRRKQDYGPRRNFKKKKVRPAEIPGMPHAFKELFDRVSALTTNITSRAFEVAEASVLEYTSSNLSNFDPHVDDTWLWGDRVVGVNFLEESTLTFVNASSEAVEVPLPRRCYFLMYNDARYEWMHAIRPESVSERRISITMRELSPLLCGEPSSEAIMDSARNFI